MEIRVLGHLEAVADGRPLALGGTKQRAVLAILGLEANRTVTTERLTAGLWGEEPPDSAAQMVQNYVWRLRRALRADGGAEILTRGRGYELCIDTDGVDAGRLERLVAEASAAAAAMAPTTAARQALALFRGEPLCDFAQEPFALVEIRRLEDLRARAAELAIETDLLAGRHRELITELDVLVAHHPLRERLQAQRMLVLYRSGRQADALTAYCQARAALVDATGVEPGPELRRLHEAILRQDPALEPPPADVLLAEKAPAASNGRAEPPPPLPPPRAPPRRRPRSAVLVLVAAAVLAGLSAVGLWDGTPRSLPSIKPEAVGIVDPRTGRIEAQLAFGGRPSGAVAAAGAVWVVNDSRGTLARVDPDRLAIVDTVAVGGDATAVAAADGAVWALSSEDRAVVRISPETNEAVARVTVGHGGRAMTSAAGSLWVANALDGDVTRVDPRAGRVLRTIRVGPGPAALGAGAGAIWVANELEGTVMRIDPELDQVIGSVRVGNAPSALAFAGGSVWVANALDGTVSRIDPASERVVDTVAVGGTPRALQATADTLWVGSDTTDVLVAVDLSTAAVRRRVRVGHPIRSLALVGDRLWIGVLAGLDSHRGGTLRLAGPAADQDVSLDPARAFSADTWPLVSVIADGLVGYRKVGGAAGATIVPNLARALPSPEDGGRTYRFRLRPGLRYSDGRFVRASDVRASVERLHLMAAPALPSYPLALRGEHACNPRRCNLSRSIETDDASGTVTFRLRKPSPDFLLHLATPTYSVLPAGTPPRPLGPELVGTGPYRLTPSDPQRLLLERNPRFRAWSPTAQPPGYPDRIEWNLRPSATERAREDIRSGGVSDRALRRLAVRAPGRVQSQIDPGFQYLFLNTRVPPFDDVRARQAVATAVDRARLARLAIGDAALPTCQALPSVVPGYEPYCPYGDARGAPDPAPNLAAARTLVQQSRSDGAAVTVTAPADVPGQVRAARALAQTLRSIGWFARVRARTPMFGPDGPGAYGTEAARSDQPLIGLAGWFADLPAASKTLPPLASCDAAKSDTLHSGYNLSRWCDPVLDRLMKTANALDATDPATAARLWARADRALVDSAAIVPIAGTETYYVTSARVGNFQYHPALFMLVSQIWVR